MNMPINITLLQRLKPICSVGGSIKKPRAIGKRYLLILYILKLILKAVEDYSYPCVTRMTDREFGGWLSEELTPKMQAKEVTFRLSFSGIARVRRL
jgi:hypothetical protein